MHAGGRMSGVTRIEPGLPHGRIAEGEVSLWYENNGLLVLGVDDVVRARELIAALTVVTDAVELAKEGAEARRDDRTPAGAAADRRAS